MTESAGLLIISNNQILLVHPTGQKWYGTYSIPKGHVEEGEDRIDAAIRETKEEIGITISKNQIEPNSEGYINYKDAKGEIYKRVYYYIVELDELIDIDKTKLQKDEINWAGFLSYEEAEKRIFWRFKPLLVYLKKSNNMKLVRESLYEKFSEEGDPIADMGIGLFAEWEKKLEERYKYNRDARVQQKDIMRIKDIITKANGDSAKENKLAQTMCKLIGERAKAYRRFLAAKSVRGISWEVTRIFLRRAAELGQII